MKNGMLHVGENCMKKSIGRAPRDRPIRSSAFKCFDTRISCVSRSTGLSLMSNHEKLAEEKKKKARKEKGKKKERQRRSPRGSINRLTYLFHLSLPEEPPHPFRLKSRLAKRSMKRARSKRKDRKPRPWQGGNVYQCNGISGSLACVDGRAVEERFYYSTRE